MMIRAFRLLAAFAALAVLSACMETGAGLATADTPPPADTLRVIVDISEQSMQVVRVHAATHETETYTWPVSTGKPGHPTSLGTFHPIFLDADHRSARYDNAPMPWSIFFHGHEAIHGTDWISQLGHRASHGCIRLHPDNAKLLYAMVLEVGKRKTWITVKP